MSGARTFIFALLIASAAATTSVSASLSDEQKNTVDFYVHRLGEHPQMLLGFENEAVKEIAERWTAATDYPSRSLLGGALVNSLLNGTKISPETAKFAKMRLYERLLDPDPKVRMDTAGIVGWMDQRESLKRIAPLLKDPHQGVRMAAASVFGGVGNLEDARFLEGVLNERRKNLTEAEIKSDASFAEGDQALAEIKKHAADPNYKFKAVPKYFGSCVSPPAKPVNAGK
ncbi:MAG: HEAT repeat domain-containing protein [Chthoniobacter sp.]|uniref:HEAT repeat domain-containing protein n=1 Tax=Chthoniobacter sp. TaxID=2510640 RepID=UPI0032ACD590